MISDQMVKNLAVFLYQFILPLLEEDKQKGKLIGLSREIFKKNPGKNKKEQSSVITKYIKVWTIIFEMLRNDKLLRAHSNYVAHIHLIKNLDCYIESRFVKQLFAINNELGYSFYIQFFKLRNENVQQTIRSIFLKRSKQRVKDSDVADIIDEEDNKK